MPGLTKPQYSVLRSIAEYPGIEQVDLTQAAVSTKATLAEMLSRMENCGLVRRENDPQDKRRRLVYLTQEGGALLAATIRLSSDVDNAFLNRLSNEEQAAFVASIRKMLQQ